jgi:RNA polymerase sigma-70 factor (ECF subfamily)
VTITVENRLRHGDDTVLTDLYRQYTPSMFAAAYGLLGNREDAAEAVQQAFVQAWRGARSFDGRAGGLQPWLYAITRRAAIDVYRRTRRDRSHVSLSDGGVHDTLAVRGPSLDESWCTWQVRSALRRLPPNERQVLVLAYFERLTHGEIARQLGIPVGTVKSRMFRAQQRLSGLLSHLRAG